MSFSVLPIAAPAPVAGASAPGGAAATGFDALLAALMGEPEAVAAQPAVTNPTPAKGATVAPADGDGAESEADLETVPTENQVLAGAAVAPPVPTPVSNIASAPEETPVVALVAAPTPGGAPLAANSEATPVPPPVAGDVQTAEATEPGSASPEIASGPESAGDRQAPPQPHASTAEPRPAVSSLASTMVGPRTSPSPGQETPPPAALPQTVEGAPTEAEGAASPAANAAAATIATQGPTAVLMAAAAAGGARSVLATARPGDAGAAEAPAKAAPASKSTSPADPLRPSAFALLQGIQTPPTAPAGLTPPSALNVPQPSLAESALSAPAAQVEPVELPDTVSAPTTAALQTETASQPDTERPQATPATVADLAAQMARKLQARSSHFDIQLQPEGLGRVDVRVDIDAQGRLTAAMAFENPQAASELRGRAGELQKALEQAGFDMSGGLSFQSPDDQRGGFAQQQQPERDGASGRAFASALGIADSADVGAVTQAYRGHRSPTGVDVRI